jgi:Pyoverdine/dityrosine biosynthesis protein
MQPVAPRSLPVLSLDKTTLPLPKLSPSSNSLPQLASCGGTAEKLLGLLTSSAVRKCSLEKMQFQRCRTDMLRAIDRRVRADKPVQLTLMAFPFKVPNPAKVGPRRMPDIAELAALMQLYKLQLKAKSIYPPGLEIHIIHDGSYIASVFGVTLEEVCAYESYFSRLVDALGAKHFIHIHNLQALSQAAGFTNLGHQAARLRSSIRSWQRKAQESEEWTERFCKTLGMINLRNLPAREVSCLLDHAVSGRLPPEYSDLERQVRVAMLRYYLRDSLLHILDPRPACFPDAIHVTTQCRPCRLAIWMVSRGRSLLPWHGVGVIDRAGKWGVELAREVLWNPSYRPFFLDGEDTPFCYFQEA